MTLRDCYCETLAEIRRIQASIDPKDTFLSYQHTCRYAELMYNEAQRKGITFADCM